MVMQTSCKKGMDQMDLLQAFEIFVDKAKGSSLGEKFYQEADPYLGFVSDKLDISKRASAIMALFADRCDDNIRYHDLEFIYKEGDAEWRCAKRGLSQGDHLFLWRSSLNIPMTMALWIESRSKLRMMPRNSFSRNSTYHPCVVLARRVACYPLRTSAPSNYSTIAKNKGKWKS